MKRTRLIAAAIAAVLWGVPLHAQGNTGAVSGRVTDAGTQEPLTGVSVMIGAKSAVTQSDGRYFIANVPSGRDSLRVRLIGYAPASQMINVPSGSSLEVNFQLSAVAVSLSEMVVVGYGQQSAGNLTSAVSQVSDSSFNTGRIVSPMELVQSKVPGLQVVDNNEPGGGLSIRIRGTTSVNASSEPLYVIDGMPVSTGAGGGLSAGRDPLNFLNPNDIESITVLRDASAAAIYGSNGANGVVLITTKGGRHGRPTIDYTTSFSASSVTKLPSMLSASQFATAVAAHASQNVGQLSNQNTDWFGLIDRTGYGMEHNLSVSGSGDASTYRLSLGYLDQDGIIRGTNTQRISIGAQYEQRLFSDRLTVRSNIIGSRAQDQFTPGGVLSNAAQFGPTQPVRDSTSATGFYEWPNNTLQSPDNPMAILALASDRGTTFRSLGNLTAQYHLPWVNGLSANMNLGYDVTEVSHYTFTAGALHSQTKTGNGGSIFRTNPNQVNTAMEWYLNYTAPLRVAPGNIDVTGGYSYTHSNADYSYLNVNGLATDLLGVNGIQGARTTQSVPNPQESKLISFYGRATWNWNDRYILTLSMRRDGSSRFGPSNAWGNFPSVSGAWRLSLEPFFRNIRNLSDLKLRASWAKTGNQAFANYQQYANYTVGDAQTQAQFGNTFVNTIRPSAVDPNIRWEATTSTDIGLDYGFHNQRFSGSIDYYSKTTKDLIFTVPIAAGTNFSNFLTTNIGSMRNRGIELALSARLMEGSRRSLGWTADFTASHNTNELLSINPYGGAIQQILVGGVAGGVGTTIQVLQPGSPMNSFFTCRQAYTAGKPVENSYLDSTGATVTGCLNSNRRAAHDPSPHWILGHSSHMTYGSFDASFTLRAYLGNYVYNNVASNLGTYSEVGRASPFNLHSSVLTTGFTTPQYLSDYYVEKASFLRMDNITVGYSFNWHAQPMRAFLTMQNAFTITGYSGVDPTAGLNGIDNNIYPRSRTISGGLTVRF